MSKFNIGKEGRPFTSDEKVLEKNGKVIQKEVIIEKQKVMSHPNLK